PQRGRSTVNPHKPRAPRSSQGGRLRNPDEDCEPTGDSGEVGEGIEVRGVLQRRLAAVAPG
ncbi:MAG: hypothetical protein ACOCV2_03460, partial [Persicimonas sp.]